MRLHPYIRGKLATTAGTAVIMSGLLIVVVLYVLITGRFMPQYAIWSPPFGLEIILCILAVSLAREFVRELPGWLNPTNHAAIKRLVRLGDYETRMAKLIDELDGPREVHGNATFTASFMLVDDGDYAIVPTDCIVWCWVSETKVKEYSMYKVKLALRGGEVVEVSAGASDRENMLLCVAQRPGYHIVGHDEGLEREWQAGHRHISEMVDELGRAGKLPAGPEAVLGMIYAGANDALARGRAAVDAARLRVAEARAKAES